MINPLACLPEERRIAQEAPHRNSHSVCPPEARRITQEAPHRNSSIFVEFRV